MNCDPKAGISNYREVAFLGWRVGSDSSPVIPIGWKGLMRIDEYKSAWVVELAEDKYTSPTLGIGVFKTFEDILRRLCDQFHKWAETSE
jgi:hypothetical protein